MNRKRANNPHFLTWLSRGFVQYGSVFGCLVAALTILINAEDFGEPTISLTDSIVLYGYLFLFYGLLGSLAAIVGWASALSAKALLKSSIGPALLFSFLWLWPLLIALMLPDVAIISPYYYEKFWHATPLFIQAATVIIVGSCLLLVASPLQWTKIIGKNKNGTTLGRNFLVFIFGLLAISATNLTMHRLDWSKATLAPNQPLAVGTAKPLVVIGVDGLGRDAIDKRDDGTLPTLKMISSSACSFELDGSFPGLTPKKWPEITTGQPSRETGVHYYFQYNLPGTSSSIQRWPLETLTSLTILTYIDRYIDIAERLICEHHLDATPIWQTAGDLNKRVSTVCWPNSKNCTNRDIRRSHSCPIGDWSSAQRAGKLTDQAIERIQAGDDLVMLYLSQLDVISHKHCKDSADTREVEDILRAIDANIGRVIQALPKGGAVLIVSDHGFDYDICTHILGIPAVAFAWSKDATIECNSDSSTVSLRSIHSTILEWLNGS